MTKQEIFLTLDAAGVFDLRNGQAVLQFDGEGNLMEVECKVKTFKRGKTIIPLVVLTSP